MKEGKVVWLVCGQSEGREHVNPIHAHNRSVSACGLGFCVILLSRRRGTSCRLAFSRENVACLEGLGSSDSAVVNSGLMKGVALLTPYDAKRLAVLKDAIVAEGMDNNDWSELARVLGDKGNVVTQHPRLLRSNYFGDPDYPDCVHEVLFTIISDSPAAFERLEDYLSSVKGVSMEGLPVEMRHDPTAGFLACPKVFSVPDAEPASDTCAIMMPFDDEFVPVRSVIKEACDAVALRPVVADEVWESPSIVQDVFAMIYNARVVVTDFSGLNPNVMYEMGLAHAMGRDVVPIAQHMEKLPFDIAHYRTIVYRNDREGLVELRRKLEQALRSIVTAVA